MKIQKGLSSIIVILIVLTIVLVTLLMSGVVDLGKVKVTEAPGTVQDSQVKELSAQSNSDEIADIEKDLNATNLEKIDQEITEIDRELNAN